MEDNATTRAIADLQELMRLMHEEIKVIKTSGVTRAGNDPLQQPGASDNAMNPGSSGYCSVIVREIEPQPRKVVYPLNSRHISLVQLQQLAQALGLQ